MPCPQDVAGKESGQIDPVKTSRIGAVVGSRSTRQGLSKEQQRHHYEVLDERSLALCGHPRQHCWVDVFALPLPSQVVKPAKGEQYEGCPGQEGDEAEGTPQRRGAR